VKDVVQANILALEKDISYEIFNVGTGRGTSVNELAGMIISRMNSDLAPEHLPKQPGEYELSIADIEKAKAYINFEPRHSIQDKLDEVIQYYKST
jgi:UDP-glucose 4-epimerase